MIVLIEGLEKGEEITPRVVNMQNNRSNFYRWIQFIENVEKIGDTYIKIA